MEERRQIPTIMRDHDQSTDAAMLLIGDAVQLSQHIFRLGSMEMTAILAQVAGQAAGCLDANAEGNPARAELVKSGLVDLFKETFLKNFDYAYNDHRAMHENMGCKTKPEPKIV